MTIRSCIPDIGVQILCVSTLIGCFNGSGCEMNKLNNRKIKVVMNMCKTVQSEDCRRRNTLLCLACINQIYSVSLYKKRGMGLFLLEK